MRQQPPRSTLFPYTTLSDLTNSSRVSCRQTWFNFVSIAWARPASCGGKRNDRPGLTPNLSEFDPPQRIRRKKCSECRLESEEHTSELQSRLHLVCRLLLEKK